MDIFVAGPLSTWKKVTSVWVAGPLSTWKQVNSGWVATAAGWKKFFPGSLTPSIESTVAISRNNATHPSTLTGTNYHWTDSTSLTYVFQKSSDNSSWSNIGVATSIANPSSSSSNTVTYALAVADMPAYTSYYRFVVTATNSTYSTTTTSTSTSVSVNQPAPANTTAPAVTPSTGTAGTTEYSTTSGVWDPVDTDGIYAYQWQYYSALTGYANLPSATASTYSPAAAHVTSYGGVLRSRVTATNNSGSTTASSADVTVSNPHATAPTSVSATTSDPYVVSISWSGDTYATKYRIYYNTTDSYPGVSPSTTYDFVDTASPYSWTSASPGTTFYFWVSSANTDDVWSAWSTARGTVTTPNLPAISTIVSNNGGTGAAYNMRWTMTATNTVSYSITVFYGSATPPTTTFTNTGLSSPISTNLGNDSNDYYYAVITPYYGAGSTGAAGTARTTSIKRNTATSTNLTNTY